ncbi:hypothetical protein Goari_021978 [Gossypium aridum]|uniref:Uncharacterized protein n=1 Tax=Gossypium aridum TaxID=34290 RepID=A0A7J8YRC4_GOSAI|nr:hypothetical protein [Gossypium aridum]
MRFTFDAKSIAELKAIAKGELEAMPSRIQALNALQGEKGFEIISEYINHLETMYSIEKRDAFPQQVGSTSSITSSIFIENGSEFNNNVVFIETKCGKGIEAWMKRGCLCWKKMQSSLILQLQTPGFQAFDMIVFNF